MPLVVALCAALALKLIGKLRQRLVLIVGIPSSFQVGFSLIERGEHFYPGTFSFLPSGHRIVYRILSGVIAATGDSLPDKRFLVWGKIDFHDPRVKGRNSKDQAGYCLLQFQPMENASNVGVVSANISQFMPLDFCRSCNPPTMEKNSQKLLG